MEANLEPGGDEGGVPARVPGWEVLVSVTSIVVGQGEDGIWSFRVRSGRLGRTVYKLPVEATELVRFNRLCYYDRETNRGPHQEWSLIDLHRDDRRNESVYHHCNQDI